MSVAFTSSPILYPDMNYEGFGSHRVLAISTVKLYPLIFKPPPKKTSFMELCELIHARILGILFQGDREKRKG